MLAHRDRIRRPSRRMVRDSQVGFGAQDVGVFRCRGVVRSRRRPVRAGRSPPGSGWPPGRKRRGFPWRSGCWGVRCRGSRSESAATCSKAGRSPRRSGWPPGRKRRGFPLAVRVLGCSLPRSSFGVGGDLFEQVDRFRRSESARPVGGGGEVGFGGQGVWMFGAEESFGVGSDLFLENDRVRGATGRPVRGGEVGLGSQSVRMLGAEESLGVEGDLLVQGDRLRGPSRRLVRSPERFPLAAKVWGCSGPRFSMHRLQEVFPVGGRSDVEAMLIKTSSGAEQ